MKIRLHKLCLFILLINMAFFSCHKRSTPVASHANNTPVTIIQVVDTHAAAGGKLLFVNLEFFKNASGKDTCVLLNTITTEGKIKSTGEAFHHHLQTDEVVCTYLSCTGQVLYEEHIDYPLSLEMDTYEESGKVTSSKVTFERKEVGLRVQVQQTPFCQLKIEKKNNTITELINTIKLGN
jgi:hypothetical protein